MPVTLQPKRSQPSRYPTSLPFVPPPRQTIQPPSKKSRAASWRGLPVSVVAIIALVIVLQAVGICIWIKTASPAEQVPTNQQAWPQPPAQEPDPAAAAPRYASIQNNRYAIDGNELRPSRLPRYMGSVTGPLAYQERDAATTMVNGYQGTPPDRNYQPDPTRRPSQGGAPPAGRAYQGNPPAPGARPGYNANSAMTILPGIAYAGLPPSPVHRYRPLPVAPGDTASIGFWHNKNGQALLCSFNGGPKATALGEWLAARFPNLYGKTAGPNNLTGKTNQQVAAFYLTLFHIRGKKLEAQVMNTALSTYATTSSLGGKWAKAYGFKVSPEGSGAATFNTGTSSSHTAMTLNQLLQAANDQAVHGVLFNGNDALRNQANRVFGGLNEAGDI